MKKGILLTAVMLSFLSQIFSQPKKSLGEEAYFEWNSIQNRQISDDGNWLVYELKPNKDDGKLIIVNTQTILTYEIDRGHKAYLDQATQKLACLINPGEIEIDSLKRKKKKDEELPTDTLLILDLNTGEKLFQPDVKSIKSPTEWSGWIFYELEKERDTTLQKILPRKLDKEESIFIAHRFEDGFIDTFNYVTSLILAKDEPFVYFSQNSPDSTKSGTVVQMNLKLSEKKKLFSSRGKIENMATSDDGLQLAWLLDPDTSKHEIPDYDIYLWNSSQDTTLAITQNGKASLPKEWIISANSPLSFSPENKKLFLGTAPKPLLQDSTLLPDEIVQVEIWNYQDASLYTQQKVQEKDEKKRTYLFVFDIQENAFFQAGTEDIPTIKTHLELDLDWGIGLDDLSMRKYLSWEGRTYKDLFLVSLIDGSHELIKNKISGNPQWSPSGKFIYWYEEPDTTWYVYDINSEKVVDLTNRDKKFSDELNDAPDYPNPYGLLGWSEDDSKIFLYDRYDIWEFDPLLPSSGRRLTKGREMNTEYRYIQLDKEEKIIPLEEWMIRGFNVKTKSELYATLNPESGAENILLSGDFQLDQAPLRTKDADAIVFTQETFADFPDLYLVRDHQFKDALKLTEANPQQADYLWGSIELVTWNSLDGQPLQGLLVKPANFDPMKKYPMIVNFYERSSDGLHQHRAPFPHRSTINYSYYASNGYVIFNPDIVYRVGYPGESAYNAVISGTQAILNMGFVDPNRVALQGHSWGGYQIAHIITKTDMFACAESGAPVVNMVSAYGGIRWGTGLSRMFQYEHTQSRLGATLWEKPELYLENSPIFNLDKVTTPVLILHNDEDSAVPWYQGIEFFVAMRRLDKPAWLLNYNGEPHWPLKWQNRLDFNRRLFQFFEHYLKATPMPVWMKEGIPAIEKGINSGLEMSEEK